MSLRTTANYLLALTSAFELLHQHGHFLFVFTAFSGINFIDYRSAVRIGTVSLFGLFATNLSIFFTGIDRLFCIIYPTVYNRIKLRSYLALIGSICVLISSIIALLFHVGAESMAELKITGTIGDFMKGSAGDFYTKFALFTNTLTIGIYIATGILIRKKSVKNVSTAEAFNRRIFRSLFLIISVNIGGYFVMFAFLVFVAPRLDPITMFFVRSVLGIVLNVSAASNAPILWLTSTDYQKAFNSHFPFLSKCIRGTNANVVVPMTGCWAVKVEKASQKQTTAATAMQKNNS
ncbi:hypothetical protein niasHT_009781 [Heterodera trifolii]|uniref:G-protein coupled receptors family 1 profile domain-containing protein n=1 Tax=Heterodera trifolii TaxID=157864 RepID=A0ABD2MFZ1_9BILA